MIGKNTQDLKAKMKGSLGGIMTEKVKPRDSLFGEPPTIVAPLTMEIQTKSPHEVLHEEKSMTKAQVFTQKLILVTSPEQKDKYDELAKMIQRSPIKKPERITANTLMRCFLNLIDQFDADTSKVRDEADLSRLVSDYFSGKIKK